MRGAESVMELFMDYQDLSRYLEAVICGALLS